MKRRQILSALPLSAFPLLHGCGGDTPEVTSPPQMPEQKTEEVTGEQPGRQLSEFGLQLSTITPLLMADFEGTLAKVAAIGYKQVEFSALGFLGRPVEKVVELLGKHGLSAPVGRISPKLPEDFGGLSRLEQMNAFRVYAGPEHLLNNVRYGLEGAAALGQKDLILPALMPDNFATLDSVKASMELLQQAAELCAREGVRFGYHNHDWEFKPVEGVVPFDLMLESFSPDLMSMQVDVYWVTKAGRDPLEYLAAHPGRFPSCHLKDIDGTGDFADVGYGEINFPEFVAAAMAAGTQYYFVERDNPPEPLQTAERAYAYLEKMTY